MSNAELQIYLANYPKEENVNILLANPKGRKLYDCENIFVIIGEKNPIVCIQVGKETDMDAAQVAVCEEDEKRNGWILCSEEMPEVPDGLADEECPEFIVMIKYAEEPTVLQLDPEGTWFDKFGEVYEVVA